MAADDPRQPRENERCRELERLIREKCGAFQRARDHAERRGCAMILKAHIERWLDEPELVVDLRVGPAPQAPTPAGVAGRRGGAEFPFDRAGEASSDAFFYCSAEGVTTELFSGADLEADPDRVFRAPGFVVTLYRKVYATPTETRNHFSSDEAFDRHVDPPTIRIWSAKGHYHVLTDPRGCAGSRACKRAFTTEEPNAAIEKADALSEEFGIRCLVAEVIGTEDTQ